MIVDTGFLVALERNDRAAWALIEATRKVGVAPIAAAGVLAQAWRGGPRQARLAVALHAIDTDTMDRDVARSVGELLGRYEADDVVDAHVALLAERLTDRPVATSDRTDLERLGVAARRIVDV